MSAVVAALTIAGGLFVAASPGASPSGPGPAEPEPPASPLPVPTGPIWPLPTTDPLDMPSGTGAGTTLPEDIIGSWYAGNVSSIGYVDPNTGSYSEGGSEGLRYVFSEDGTWSFGYLITSQLYACLMRVMVYREGIVDYSDPVAHLLHLDARTAQIHSEDSCAADGDDDRDLPPDDEVLLWHRTADEYGDVLFLRSPTSGYSAFRPSD
jgi:hypothetical protein